MSITKAPSKASQQRLVEKINKTYEVGDKLRVRQDNGEIEEWTLRNEATMLGGHTAVIWVEEHRSCYSADRVVF